MAFVGVLLDTVKLTLEVTQERLKEILDLLSVWSCKVVATRREVQSLLGKLQFVASCVRPDRVFISRILNLLRGLPDKGATVLPESVKKDVFWWYEFMPLYNGVSMMALEEWSKPDSVFSSDACLSGCGAFAEGRYFHSSFPSVVCDQELHITQLEMLTVVVATKLWCYRWRGKRIQVFCDNNSSVQVINSGRTRDAFLQSCLRELCFVAAIHEFEMRAVHIAGVDNRLCDLLSRWDNDLYYREEFNRLSCGRGWKEAIVPSDLFSFSHDW
jgi:hypothetical protein